MTRLCRGLPPPKGSHKPENVAHIQSYREENNIDWEGMSEQEQKQFTEHFTSIGLQATPLPSPSFRPPAHCAAGRDGGLRPLVGVSGSFVILETQVAQTVCAPGSVHTTIVVAVGY